MKQKNKNVSQNITKMLHVRINFKTIKKQVYINIFDNIEQLKIESKANKTAKHKTLQRQALQDFNHVTYYVTYTNFAK